MRLKLLVFFLLTLWCRLFAEEPVLGENSHLITGEIVYAIPESGSGYITDIRLFWKSLVFLEEQTAHRRGDRKYLFVFHDQNHFIEIEKERKNYLITIEDKSRHFSAMGRINKSNGNLTILKGPDYIGKEGEEDPFYTALEIKKYIEEFQEWPDLIFFMADSLQNGISIDEKGFEKQEFEDFKGILVANEVFTYLSSDTFRYIDNDYYYRPQEVEANKFYDGDDFALYMWFKMVEEGPAPKILEIQQAEESIYKNNLVICVYPVPGGWMWVYSRKLGNEVFTEIKDIPAAIMGEDVQFRIVDPVRHWIENNGGDEEEWIMSRLQKPLGMEY